MPAPIGIKIAPEALVAIWLLPYIVNPALANVEADDITAATQYSPGVILTFIGTVSCLIDWTDVLAEVLAVCDHAKLLLALPELAKDKVEPFNV